MSYMELYKEWLDNPYFDEATKKELKEIEGNEKEIEDRFYTELEFGTAGEPYEHLYSQKSNTGTGKLYYCTEGTGKRCCDCV